MQISNLIHGELLGRRKRFFADVRVGNETLVAHCPNTGSMRSLLRAGTQAILSHSADPKRKLAYTLEALQLPDGTLACVNTQRPNAQVAQALAAGLIRGIPANCHVEREVVYKQGTRFDARVQLPDGSPIWIEVKNVTLVEASTPSIASFPDAVTERGTKHLHELTELAKSGVRAAMFYLVNRTDAKSFVPASAIDPVYTQALREATQAGVEVFVYRVDLQYLNGTLTLNMGAEIPWGFP